MLGLFFACLGLRVRDIASVEKAKGIIPPIPGGNPVKSNPEYSVETPEKEIQITDDETKPEQ